MIAATLFEPDTETLLGFFRRETAEGGRWLQVAGEMEVVYHGRAASSADAGDYLLLLKPDRSLQIHAARGIKPLNWQPVVDGLEVFADDGRAILVAERATPHELVRVAFLDVAYAVATVPRDEGGLVLRGSEAQMQRALAANPDVIEEGLELVEMELPTDVGGIDLYARDAEGRLVVVELKRGRATHEAVQQLQRYVARLRETLAREVRGILASPEVTAPARTRLEELGLEYRPVTALPDVAEPGLRQGALFGDDGAPDAAR